jgi:hypothetical protein
MNINEYQRLRHEIDDLCHEERARLQSELRANTIKREEERRALWLRYRSEHNIPTIRSRPNPPPIITGLSIRETCVLNRYRLTALEISKQIGISRNAVIGHWFRERAQ